MNADSFADDVELVDITAWLEASVDEAWHLWTSADELERWWWPMFDDTRYEVDARVGGWYRFSTASGGMGVEGRYLVVNEGETLRFTWVWMSAEREEIVEVSFSEADGGTLVRVRQTAPQDETTDIREGWQDTLTRLEELDD